MRNNMNESRFATNTEIVVLRKTLNIRRIMFALLESFDWNKFDGVEQMCRLRPRATISPYIVPYKVDDHLCKTAGQFRHGLPLFPSHMEFFRFLTYFKWYKLYSSRRWVYHEFL